LVSVGRDARALAARSPFWEVADPGEVGVFSKAARDRGVTVLIVYGPVLMRRVTMMQRPDGVMS
jgi:hypothetical protein